MSVRNLSISTRTAILAALVVSVVVGSASLTQLGEARGRAALAGVAVAEQTSVEQIIPLALLSKDIRLNIVEVQQWLTDISATRGFDGLNDGYDQAAAQALSFTENVGAANRLATSLGLADVVETLAAVSSKFAAYYEAGKRMAAAYVAEGPAGGNRMMPEFDAAAEALKNATEALGAATDASLQRDRAGQSAALDQFASDQQRIALIALVASALTCLITLLMVASYHFTVTRPIKGLQAGIAKLRSGNYSSGFPDARYRDEIGVISRALLELRDRLAEADRLRAEQADASAHAARENRRTLDSVAHAFEQDVGGIVASVASSATQMQNLAQSLSNASTATNERTARVSAASDGASSNVSSVASASEQLSAAIGEISSRIAETTKVSGAARERVARAAEEAGSLVESAKRIGKIVTLISDIAAQTNLLALNATIEAARAGPAGRGFAVVASEVRALATQTSTATQDVSRQVEAVQDATRGASAAMREIIGVIETFDQISRAVADAVEEQTASTGQISRNAHDAYEHAVKVGHDITDVAKAAAETGRSATLVLAAAGSLADEAAALRGSVSGFLTRVRIAA